MLPYASSWGCAADVPFQECSPCTEGCTYDANVWDVSIVHVPFSVAPCPTLIVRFATCASLSEQLVIRHMRVGEGYSAAPAHADEHPGARRRRGGTFWLTDWARSQVVAIDDAMVSASAFTSSST